MTTLTADQVIARAKLWYPSLVPASGASPDGLDLLNEVYSEILFRVQLLSVEADITLTADTAHYSMPTGTVRLWSARYVRTATAGDFRALRPTNQDRMDLEELDYLKRASGEPQNFWALPKSDGTPEIWLDPPPDTTTTGGYPKVTVRVTKFTALTSGGANPNLPIGLPSYDAFVIGLARKWAYPLGDEKLQLVEAQYEDALHQLENYRHSLIPRVNPTVRPRVTWRARRV